MIDTSKKFLVAGAGKSGIGSVNLLLKTGADVSLYDGKEDLEKEALYEKLYEKKEIPLILGNITKEDVSKFDLLVLSPGISVNAPIAQMFRDQEKPVWSEIELAYQASKGRIAAITGTNGKTTTTALTGEIMKGYYESSFVVGNIGIPYTSVALDTKEDSVTTAEISSFQLETIVDFKPDVCAVLNIRIAVIYLRSFVCLSKIKSCCKLTVCAFCDLFFVVIHICSVFFYGFLAVIDRFSVSSCNRCYIKSCLHTSFDLQAVDSRI